MELKIGTRLTLEPILTEREENFHCRIVEQHNNIIFIDYPVNVLTKKVVFLVDGAQFRVTFSTDSNENYIFNTEVLGRRAGNIQMIMLKCPPKEEFIKIQRREFVRIETPVDVSIEFNNQFYPFVAEDISAGGTAIQIKSPVEFKDGDHVRMIVVLPFSNGDVSYIETDAVIVRIFERGDIHIATVRFTGTDDLDKQQIVRFCFERQLMFRKRKITK